MMIIHITGQTFSYILIGILVASLFTAITLTFTKLIPAIKEKSPVKVDYAVWIGGAVLLAAYSSVILLL